jgi:saccharopine dehydrogenase-like NADP-dependent oxidoreductase
MKVFVLGGYGKTGLPAIQLLAQSDLVTQIAVVGRSLERAEKAVAQVGEKAIAVQADGTDEQVLTSLLAGYDIILNAAYHKSVPPAIKAALRTGTHYCDVASWGGFLEQALQLNSEARTAGITAIIAVGISPCISNLMGVYAARQLDEVQQLQIGRADIFDFRTGRELTPQQWLEDPRKCLAALHEFRPFIAMNLQGLQKNGIRKVLDYQDGQWVEVDPIKNGQNVPLTQGGTTRRYPYSSGRDFFGTLPRDLSPISPVDIHFTAFPPQLDALLREQALRVLGGDVDTETAVNAFYDSIEDDHQRWLYLPDDFAVPIKLWVTAVGRKEGRAARHSCRFTPAMWNIGGYFLTSVALAAAARLIMRGEIQERGVITAETAFEPLSFFEEVIAVLPESPPVGRLIDESFEWLE